MMLSQSGKSSESTNVRVSLIICIAGLIMFAVYVVIHFLLPLD
jgi:type IV secretory pathway component VirB8